jgi:RHS repeat-associated protein
MFAAAVPAAAATAPSGPLAWGYNVDGEVGDGTTTNRSAPVPISGIGQIVALSGGFTYSLALRNDGAVFAWGSGMLGDGTSNSSLTPVQVPTLSNIRAIAGGGTHALALDSSGYVWAWGDDHYGEIGNGTLAPNPNSYLSPVRLNFQAVAIAAGDNWSMALDASGNVWAWGDNSLNELADGNPQDYLQTQPQRVAGIGGITAIAAGQSDGFALRSDGTVWAWGSNTAGAGLGDGTTYARWSPVEVQTPAGASGIAAGYGFSLALYPNGTVRSWGYGGNGSLGNGSTSNALTSVAVSISGVAAVGVSGGAGYALEGGGTEMAWGENESGQLGNGNTTKQTKPVTVSTITQASALGGNADTNTAYAINGPVPGLMTPPVGGNVTPTELYGGGDPSEPNCMCSQTNGGDPVNTLTGNYSTSFSDLSIPGRGLPLGLSRSYNSLAAGANGPFGYGWTFSYGMSLDASANAATVTQEDGSQVSFTLSNGTYTAVPRVIASLVANPDGSYTFTRLHKQVFTFNVAGQLVSEADLNGYLTTLAYNPSGQLATVTDPAGRTLSFTWTGNNITAVTDSASPPRQVSYDYDGSGDLTDVIDVGGGDTHLTYDSSHRLLTVLDPDQHGSSNPSPLTTTYDSSGRVTQQKDAMGRITSFDYTSVPGSTKVTDPNGNVRLDTYEDGELVQVTYGYGTAQAATWGYSYDPNTLGITKVTDPNGHASTATYDPATGRQLTSTDALNRKTTYTYDNLGDTTSVTDPANVTTSYTYDTAGNLQFQSTPLVGSSPVQYRTTTYIYGDSSHPGDVTAKTDPDSQIWGYGYDAYGDLASLTDPLGNETTYGYDSIGRRTSMVSARGNVTGGNPATYTTTYGYDAFGDQSALTDPLGHGTTETYDADRNLLTQTDADNSTTTYSYDLDRELTGVTRPGHTTLGYGYDADGNQNSQTDGLGHATTYAFADPALPTKVTSVTDADNRKTTYGYDGAGNQTTVTDPSGRVTTLAYDAADQLGSISYSDGVTPNVTAMAYDPDGQRTSMTDGTGMSSWTYDSLHRLTSETNGASQTVSYGYDLVGNQTSITYPGDKAVSQVFDAADSLHTVTDWLGNTTNYSYDPDSELTTEAYPNSTTAATTYDPGGNVSAITDSASGTTYASFSYTRNGDNLLTSTTPTGVGQSNETYGYTALNQLQSVSTANSPYAYDAAGNVTTLANGSTLSYDPADQIQGRPYDAQGNRLASGPAGATGSLGYGYDQADRLDAVSQPTPGMIAGGADHTVALGSGGTVWDWGYNNDGQLGNNSTTTSKVPIEVSGLTGMTMVAAGRTGYHTLALKSDGTVWAWGLNTDGQLGNNSTTTSKVPVQVTGLTGATAIVAGADHSLTLRSDGTVWAWGYNSSGQLGNNSTTTSKVPVEVSGLSGITQIAAGASHSLALRSDGTVWAWGANTDGQLGNKSTTGSKVPVETSSLVAGAIGSGDNHSLALASAGSFWAWGYDTDGQLGNNSTTNSTSPVQSMGVSSVGATYAYNGDGLRMTKTVNGAAEPFVWDTSGTMPQMLVDGTTDYLYGPGGQPLEAIDAAGNTTYFDEDATGSTRVLTNSAGAVAGTVTYDAYGQMTGSTGLSSPIGYAGQYRDAETGLSYLRARYYDPETAQLLTVDPEASATGARYSYAGDDPINGSDPTGLDGWGCVGNVCLSDGVHGLVNFGAGVANFAVQTATARNVSVGQVYCGPGQGASYAIGVATGAGETALAAGAVGAAEEEGPLTFTTTGGKTVEIPDDYVSGSSRTQGGTIYRPPGNSPTDLSNAIRVMPPNAQYPDGYVIEYDAHGNPMAPDGTVPKTRGDYHQPLAP